MKLSDIRTLLAFAGLAICIGCGGPDATLQGTVTIDGQLARGGVLTFHPVEGGPTAYGTIADNGSYSVRIGQGDLSDPDASGVRTGEYIVTAVVNMPSVRDETVGEGGPPKPGARLTAEKYANKETSDLRVTVKPGLNVVPLELEGAAADEKDAEAESSDAATEAEPGAAVEEQEKGAAEEPAEPPADDETTPPTESATDAAPEAAVSPAEGEESPAGAQEQTP